MKSDVPEWEYLKNTKKLQKLIYKLNVIKTEMRGFFELDPLTLKFRSKKKCPKETKKIWRRRRRDDMSYHILELTSILV